MTNPLTFPMNRRTAAIIGTPYLLPDACILASKPAASTLEHDGSNAITFDAFGLYTFTSATGPHEVVALPESVRTAACFHGADGLQVWRSLCADPEFELVDLSTVTALRCWPDRRDGRGIPATLFGGNHPGSAQHTGSGPR